MSGRMVLTNAQVVTRHDVLSGSVVVESGVVSAVEPGRRPVPGALDLGGDYLLPGVVELHTDVLEKHWVPRPGVQWPATAAVVAHDAQLAAAGITTVLDGFAVGYIIETGQRPRDPAPFARAIRTAQEAGLLRCEHFLHMRCEVSTEWVLRDFEPFASDPMVRLVSLMDHTPGQRQFVRVDKYREYNQGKYGLSDGQMDELIERRLADQARYGHRHRAAIVALCQKRGLTLASHDDATPAHVEEAVEEGIAVAEFPTTLEAARAARAYGLAIVAGAPNLVCGRSHSGNVSAAELAHHGLLDVLSSDYVPSSALHAAFLLHVQHGVPLPAAVATVSLTPAQRVGLDDRGEIAPGRRADLIRVRVVDDLAVVIAVWRRGGRIA
ncbi:MAG: alpha-D-ribose 1-methylphosphonate 5-triphosphate diphosphatase [Candidatus Rokuibacteriota bacterium]